MDFSSGKNILIIKGGGARGLIATRLLIEIQKHTKYDINQIFDFVGGCSVGALIGSGLVIPKPKHDTTHICNHIGIFPEDNCDCCERNSEIRHDEDNINPLRFTPESLHNLFLSEMKSAFTWTYSSWIASGFGWFGPKYTNIGLTNIINNICDNTKINDLLLPIIFPSFDITNNKAHYFTKDNSGDLLLRDVLLSTTAAPTYFPSHHCDIDGKKCEMIDGVIVTTNPAQITLLHAMKQYNEENLSYNKSKICELIIGTGSFDTKITSQGLYSWAGSIIGTFMQGSNDNELYELSMILPPDNFYVMDIPMDAKYDSTDDIKEETLNHYINETEKWILLNTDNIIKFCNKLVLNKGLQIR